LAQQKTLDVVDGFIKVMDGEKDPRNLLVAFSIAQRIIQNFDITSHVEASHINVMVILMLMDDE
jgi:hypothetical protein